MRKFLQIPWFNQAQEEFDRKFRRGQSRSGRGGLILRAWASQKASSTVRVTGHSLLAVADCSASLIQAD